jgi:aminopeptidase N
MKTIYLKDYKEPEFECKSCELIFELFEEYVLVTNTMLFYKKDKEAKDIKLDALELELLELYMDEQGLKDDRYAIKDEKLIVFDVGESFSLKIKNKIYPQKNSELEGLYKSGSIFCTQNEPEGFRRITPYLDRPDVMSVFKTTIIADKSRYPILLSNGNKLHSEDMDNNRHKVLWHDPHPKPSYLFALVAGDLGVISDEFITMSKKRVELNIYCDKGNESKCHHAMKSLKEAFVWDEQKYGREYDLELYNIVAVDSFNMGAMENKGLNIFNSAYVLADETSATDANFMGIQSVIAHEYFHNWTGNRITCRDWFQLTLKEGLTVFRDQCFSADLNSKEVQRIEDVKALRQRQFVEDASPTSHPIQPDSYISMNNFYTATVYEKGAEVIRMIHTLLGEKSFREAMDFYFESYDGKAITTDDFLYAMNSTGKIDIDAFKLWYHQSGTPRLQIQESFDNGRYTLKLTQEILDAQDGSKQQPYYYPLKMALINQDGVEVHNEMLIVSKGSEEFVFDGFDAKPYLSINRDFSAPIIIKNDTNNYPFLMKHDSNSFIRYESAQLFALQTIKGIMESNKVDAQYLDAYGYLLDLDAELSYKSLLLELPSISNIMQNEEVVDFEMICDARDVLKRSLVQRHKDKFLKLYEKNHQPSSKKLDAQSIAKRAIKNTALKMLAILDNDEIAQIAQKQYKDSITMTDKIVALSVLEGMKKVDAQNVLNDFYDRYKNDTLVMNKYFATIALADREGVLERVKELELDDSYDEKVPNLVRSLIGSFSRNYRYFHAKDGSGYKYLSDKIIKIDKINPQMASSLCGAFKIYKKLNPINQKLMKKELECVVSTHSLSKNTYEIVHKIL